MDKVERQLGIPTTRRVVVRTGAKLAYAAPVVAATMTVTGRRRLAGADYVSGGEGGCTPGFVKNCMDDTPLAATKMSTAGFNGTGNLTFGQAVEGQGTSNNDLRQLRKHAAAAYFNVTRPGIEYPISLADIVALYNAAVAAGGDVEGTKDTFDEANNGDCPLSCKGGDEDEDDDDD